MAKYKCKMCGAPLDVVEGQTTITCSFCQSKQTVANPNDERKENLFNRANRLRSICDFDKAILSYQSIISIFPTEAEAYWGLCLSKYGIEYVDDPITHKKIPTIHRVSYDSILKDSDYLMALSYADVIAKEEYQLEAKEIAEIQLNILAISQKEEPFDIFICYKETDEKGKRTPDSVLSQEIYNTLTDKGYKVFFSRITLESKLGSMYEPYIFAALNSAKIMLVVGTKKEYFEAIWVKNEWSRFIDLMKIRPDHYLIPCYKNIDAYEMPEQFLAFQGQDMSKLGFMQDLIRGIDKIMGRNDNIKIKQETTVLQSDVNISALLKRAEILISDNDFTKADALIERVLDNDPTNSQAYLLKLLIELQLHSIEELKTFDNTIETNGNFKKAYKFGDSKQQAKLNEINELIKENIEKEQKELIKEKYIKEAKKCKIDGNYVYLGEYPQTIKEDSITITSDTPDSDGYYLGSDGERYVEAVARPCETTGWYLCYFSNKQQIVRGKTFYFKVEPIKWKILQVNGTQYKLVTDLIIDNQKFHSSTSTRIIDGKTIYPNNYEYSDIRKWLNEDFYNRAFTKELQSYINTTLVDNSVASTGDSSNKYICNDTYDKVYLLSYTDITNEEYGFTNDVSREKQLTDYAKAKGVFFSGTYPEKGNYWLRSPYFDYGCYARYVNNCGSIYHDWVYYVRVGVSAAITISLD